jgi:predicted metalloprotease with PDZ domain
MRTIKTALWLLSSLSIAAHAAPRRDTNYEVHPVIEAGALVGLDVSMTFRADPSGRTEIELPDRFGGVGEHWRHLSALVAKGARIETLSSSERLLLSSPNARIRIQYRVNSAYSKDPDSNDGNLYDGSVIRPAWFETLGEFLFATPKGGEHRPARLSWVGWPNTWRTFASARGAQVTVEDVAGSLLIGGTDLDVRARPILGGTLTVIQHGRFNWSADVYADHVARIISAQRAFWRAKGGDYMAALVQLAAVPGLSSSGGTARTRGFMQYAAPDTDLASLIHTIAHEHIHNWIPSMLGSLTEQDRDTALWFSEGFTDFYTARTLVAAGIWSPSDFIDDMNRALGQVAASPVANAPNALVAKNFWSDEAYERIAYDRGLLFAHLIDWQLRDKGGLDRLIFAMQDRWRAAPADRKPALLENFEASAASAGLDVTALVGRYVDRGETIVLPPGLLGECATIAQVAIPVFDLGFDPQKSAEAGHFAGVDPQGQAYAAGLRDGMERISRLGGRTGDSRIPLTYRVRDAAGEKVISWRPEGKEHLTLQQVELTPQNRGTLSDACRQSILRRKDNPVGR